MSRALELAEKCDMVIEDRLVLYLSQDGMSDGPIFFSQLERFYALAKAEALREAAARFSSNQITALTWPESELTRMAEELEKQA